MTQRTASAAALFALFSLVGSGTAQAAYITIDDSDLANITITAGDFENGFSVNGTQLTSGLGNSNSITLPDGGYTIEGSWIDLGRSSGRVDILFALLGDPTGVTSGVEMALTTDGSVGTLSGSVGGFTGSTYFVTALATFPQLGGTQIGAAPFLSISFTPEGAAVPEPSTMLLLSGALPLLYAASRRRRV